MLKTEEYLEIVNKRGKERKPLNRVYRNIRNKWTRPDERLHIWEGVTRHLNNPKTGQNLGSQI